MNDSGYGFRVPASFIAEANEPHRAAVADDYSSLGERLLRAGRIERAEVLDSIVRRVASFPIALPSWGLGRGGTRFGRFPGPGEPQTVVDKLVDAATVYSLAGGEPRVSLHLPWDRLEEPAELSSHARALGVRFDAMNSNTFEDRPENEASYRLGSLAAPDRAVRAQAVRHNIEVIEYGSAIGSDALTVWLADGSNFPGQIHFRRSFARAVESLAEIHEALPPDWQLLVEYKPYEPAFYSTVLQDWGSALLACRWAGERARVLVDLGHHLPGTNVEQIVARLITAERLGGFHFNDSHYGDDDLITGSIRPHRLFLIFHELADAEADGTLGGPCPLPAYMIDQSHNIEDPIEALIVSLEEIRRAYARALLVDRTKLRELEDSGDVLLASRTLREAFETDVSPILAVARERSGAAIDPIGAYRSSGYRARKASERRAERRFGGGIV